MKKSQAAWRAYFSGDPEPRILPADATPPWRVTQLSIATHLGMHVAGSLPFLHKTGASSFNPKNRSTIR
jgi:hypothetical protein